MNKIQIEANIAQAKANIAARQALGMTADQYAKHLEHQKQLRARERQIAIRNCIVAGCRGSEADMNRTLKTYLEVTKS